MVINLRRYRRQRADARGRIWWIGTHRPRRTHINMRRYRVFLDGNDVTTRTYYVDSRRGIVRMFKHNDDGLVYLDPVTREPAQEKRRGKVKLIRRKEAA